MPDAHLMDTGSAYISKDLNEQILFDDSNLNNKVKAQLDVNGDEMMSYIYGVLHHPSYIKDYEHDLKRGVPRIPLLEEVNQFVNIGNKLIDLHLNYEKVESYSEVTIDFDTHEPTFHVQKMKFGRGKDKSVIIFNKDITIRNIPDKAYEYIVNGRSAIEWIMDQYRVKTDGKSGIVDDPNDYSEDPKYIFNLLLSIINVSVQTVDLVNSLPPLEIIEE